METETKQIGFFQRMKIAIFKLEDYGKFLGEKPSKAFKYFFLLMFIFSIFISACLTYSLYKPMSKGIHYIENELPDFTLKDGILHFDDYVEGYDEETDFRIIINTFDMSDDDAAEYALKLKKTGRGLLLLKDKLCYYEGGELMLDDKYIYVEESVGLSVLNRAELLEHFNTKTMISLTGAIFVIYIVTAFLINSMIGLADVCFISIVGWFIARMCRLSLKMIGSIELTIYALTLSMVLNTIYVCANYIYPGFNIEYFRIIYILIAYVYLIGALFMIRFDLMKEQEELNKVYEAEKEVKEELKEKTEKKKKEEKPQEEETKETEKPETKEEKNVEEKPEKESEEPEGSEI